MSELQYLTLLIIERGRYLPLFHDDKRFRVTHWTFRKRGRVAAYNPIPSPFAHSPDGNYRCASVAGIREDRGVESQGAEKGQRRRARPAQ